jgi:pimeloyl-ACP methyl ester carboxylesterase
MRIGRRALLAATLAAPLPVRAEATKSADIRFAGAGGIELAGTLLLPRRPQKIPGVVLVAGSGPTDRDGNNPLIPVKVDLLKQLAERLAEAGIASLRYDKRGIGRSTRAPARLADQELFFGWENFIGDVQLAHAELVRHDEVKGYATALLGHSEGGLFAIATAAMSSAARAPYALVLAGTPGRRMGDIIRSQLQRGAPQLVEPAERIMAEIRRTRHVPAEVPRELAVYFPPYIGAFLQGELNFDPAAALSGLQQPCLLLQGSADQQVVPLDDIQPLLDALSKRSAPGEAALFPLVSHNFKPVAGPGDPGFAGPIATPVGDKLAAWLAATLGA